MQTRLFFALLFFCAFIRAQNVVSNGIDSLSNDSLKIHSPRKAMLFSAIIPGAGQIYNHNAMTYGRAKIYLKLPLIYSTLAVSSFFLIEKQRTLHSIKQEFENRKLNNLNLNPKWSLYSTDEDLEIIYKQNLTYRDLSILAVGAIYFIQIIDANIEAHFVNFDISPDLSFQLYPKVINTTTAGVGLKLNFH